MSTADLARRLIRLEAAAPAPAGRAMRERTPEERAWLQEVVRDARADGSLFPGTIAALERLIDAPVPARPLDPELAAFLAECRKDLTEALKPGDS